MTTQQTRRTEYTESVTGERNVLLRTVLKLDAVATGAVGALLLFASSVLDDLLGTPTSLLVPVSLFLLVYAAAIFLAATRPTVNRTLAWGAVIVNAVWAIDSVLLVALGRLPLTTLGVAFVLFQGAVVALFAIAQAYALRNSA